jgi:hypothetical protein
MFTRRKPLAHLEIGDYFYGRHGQSVLWKVIAKREDGYYGIQNGDGEKIIVKPEHAVTEVQQVIYGFDSEEEAEAAALAAVKEAMPESAVIARKIEPGDWIMPSLDELYADDLQLRVHLRVHHGETHMQRLEHDDLTDIHGDRHAQGADHTHADA